MQPRAFHPDDSCRGENKRNLSYRKPTSGIWRQSFKLILIESQGNLALSVGCFIEC